MIRRIVGTMDEILLLRDTDLCIMVNFIYDAYGACDDFKSCTGVPSTMGFEVLASMCVKKKLTKKSLIESEIVGVADYLPKVSYLRLFIEAEGSLLKRNIILQDNI